MDWRFTVTLHAWSNHKWHWWCYQLTVVRLCQLNHAVSSVQTHNFYKQQQSTCSQCCEALTNDWLSIHSPRGNKITMTSDDLVKVNNKACMFQFSCRFAFLSTFRLSNLTVSNSLQWSQYAHCILQQCSLTSGQLHNVIVSAVFDQWYLLLRKLEMLAVELVMCHCVAIFSLIYPILETICGISQTATLAACSWTERSAIIRRRGQNYSRLCAMFCLRTKFMFSVKRVSKWPCVFCWICLRCVFDPVERVLSAEWTSTLLHAVDALQTMFCSVSCNHHLSIHDVVHLAVWHNRIFQFLRCLVIIFEVTTYHLPDDRRDFH